MRRRPRALVNSLSCLILISVNVVACQHAEQASRFTAEIYEAADIDIERGTVDGEQISSLADTEVRLKGLVRSSVKGSTVMYLTRDKNAVDVNSFGNCINLIFDKRLKFNSPNVSDRTFVGEFVLIDHFDASVVHLRYMGIGFSTDCQALKQSPRYPYFFVKDVHR